MAGSSPRVLLQNPTLEAKNETGVTQCGSRLSRCLISQSSLPLEPGVALASRRSEPNKHKNGHSWPQPLLPRGPPFVPQADTAHRLLLQLPAAHSNSRSHPVIFQSAAGSWTPEQRGLDARWQARLSVFSVGSGSSCVWFLLLQDSFPSPRAHSSVSAQVLLITQRPVVFVGFHPLLIKPIFIQYARRECGFAICYHKL